MVVVAFSHFVSCFNPRSRKGNDDTREVGVYMATGFNPRSRKGNDQGILKSSCVN